MDKLQMDFDIESLFIYSQICTGDKNILVVT